MKIQQFNGGLNTRLAPQMVSTNQGVKYNNIDPTSGVLAPLKDKLTTGISADQYIHYFDAEDEWVSSTVPTEYLEFQGTLYSTDGVQPQKRKNGQTHNLGIKKPSATPSLTAVDSLVPLDTFTVANSGTGGDLPVSDFAYALVNEKNGVYSAPYFFTVFASNTEIVRADGSIEQLGPDGTYEDKTDRHPRFGARTITVTSGNTRSITFSDFKGALGDSALLYRFYNGKWRLLTTITSLSDTFTDSVEDISANDELDISQFSAFNGTYQYVYTYYNINDGTESAPSELSVELDTEGGYIQVGNIQASSDPQTTNIRLYRVGGNITKFTLVAELANVTQTYDDKLKDTEVDGRLLESENYSEAPSNLRFISESYAMLFGAVGSTLRFTPIGVPNAWPPEYSIQFDNAITGIAPVANGILVMSKFKTYIVTGTGPLTLAQQSLRGDQGCVGFSSIQEVVEGMAVWASADGLCTSSGNNVTVITKHALGKRELTPVSSAVVDEVYYCLESSGNILVWDYRFDPIFREINPGVSSLAGANSELYGWSNGTIYSLFKDTNNLSYTYKSPRYTEGSLTLPKTYKKIYFRHEGDIIIDIIINDVLVATKQLTGKDTTEFQVPQDKQRGPYIQFEVTGTGELSEIEYTVSETRNG